MNALDLSNLTPSDAVVALRSYPRRYRAALAPVDDDESIEELAARVGPDGHSAVELATDTVRTWTVLGQALHQLLVADTPVIHPAVLDASQRHWDAPVVETVDSVLEQLGDGAGELADEIERMSAEQWKRRATAAGGASVGALDLAREAVRVGHDNLAAVERTLAALRR